MGNEKQYRAKLGSILMGLAGNFGDEFDTPTLNMWDRMFKADGIKLSQIENAAERIMRTRKISKMPTYAEFLEYIQGFSQDTATQQADMVLGMLRRHGHRANPEFEDSVTAYLMRTRWPYRQWAQNVKESEIVWWRKEFISAYQSYAKIPERIPADHQIEAGENIKKLTTLIGGKP